VLLVGCCFLFKICFVSEAQTKPCPRIQSQDPIESTSFNKSQPGQAVTGSGTQEPQSQSKHKETQARLTQENKQQPSDNTVPSAGQALLHLQGKVVDVVLCLLFCIVACVGDACAKLLCCLTHLELGSPRLDLVTVLFVCCARTHACSNP
jgi:hypothetical protein